MAPDHETMTPVEAIATLGSVRGYRQALTHRAAGIVWMVWGLTLAGLAVSINVPDMGAAVQSPDERIRMVEGAFIGLAFWAVVLVAGAISTNAVWRAHAIEREESHKSWVAYLVAFGLVALMLVASVLIMQLLSDSGLAPNQDTIIVVGPILGALGALALAVLLRGRVPFWPGLLVALALVIVQVVLPLLVPSGSLELKAHYGHRIGAMAILASYLGVGLWFFRRG